MQMKAYAFMGHKGGTGKTTTTVNFSAALTRKGKRVLLVGMDPQSSLEEYFFPNRFFEPSMNDALVNGTFIEPVTLGPLVSLLPATIDLAAAEIILPTKRNQERTLLRYLRQYDGIADVCLIDCAPSLGVLTSNALTASCKAIVPISTEIMAERTIKLIEATIRDIRETELNPDLSIWRIIPTLYDQRLLHHQEVFQAMREKYADLVYPDPMRSRARYKDAVSAKVDVAELDAELGKYWDSMVEVFCQEEKI